MLATSIFFLRHRSTNYSQELFLDRIWSLVGYAVNRGGAIAQDNNYQLVDFLSFLRALYSKRTICKWLREYLFTASKAAAKEPRAYSSGKDTLT
jgi:hypothetical protein